MNRRHKLPLLSVASLILVLSACAASRITASWSDPNFSRDQIHSILVLGVSDNDLIRRVFEDEMVDQLRQFRLEAIPSYPTVSDRELPEKNEMDQWMNSRKVDGVLVARLVGMRQEAVVQPGYISNFGYNSPGHYWNGSRYPWIDPYRGWYSYYSGSYDVIYEPPTVSYYPVYTVETTLYAVASDRPVWSARSEISPKENVNQTLEEFVSALIENMADEGVI